MSAQSTLSELTVRKSQMPAHTLPTLPKMFPMMRNDHFQHNQAIANVSVTLLSLMLLMAPTVVLAHAGHGDEFKGARESNQTNESIQVDAETAKRLGIKVEIAKSQQLGIGIKTTGQIETLPNKKVEVTTPIAGKVVELLVEPGIEVKAGQPVAVLSSSELVELRVNSQEKRAEAQADLQKAIAELKLAQQNYERYLQIAEAEITSAKTQLKAAKSQYNRDRALVDRKAVIKVAQQNYQRQVQIADAEIVQAKTELAVAQEQYDRDRDLVAKGALPRRQMLESKAHLAEARSLLAKASSRQNVLQAETEVRRAEVDLPLRELRESQAKLAEAQAQLTKASTRRDVIEAEAQLKRAQSAVEIAQSRIRLSNTTYQTRLQQLGSRANASGLVTVSAPISGMISDREATLGQSFEDAGGKLMTIVNGRRVFATANIYEKDLNQIKTGQRVTVKVSSQPNRTFSGRIATISSVVEGESRIVPVKAELDNPDGLLKPGMFAELEIIMERSASSRLAIPHSAVVEANGKNLVYIQNGNAFQPTEVTLGQTSGDMVEIKSGLFEGDAIVTQRAPQLYAQSLRGSRTTESHSLEHTSIQNQKSEIQNNLPWWWVIPAGGGIGAIAFGSFWLGRRTKPQLIENTHQSPQDYPIFTEEIITNEQSFSESDKHHIISQESAFNNHK